MANIAVSEPFRRGGSDGGRVDPFEGSVFDMLPMLFRPVLRGAGSAEPRMDVLETGEAYRIAVDLPGVKKDAIQVTVYENSVTIGAEVQEQKESDQDVSWLLRERGFGKFSRTLALPEAVDERASDAKFTDGVLHLTLPKKRPRATKRLTIQ